MDELKNNTNHPRNKFLIFLAHEYLRKKFLTGRGIGEATFAFGYGTSGRGFSKNEQSVSHLFVS
ncbi:MAG: hypothetical protein B6245_09930 [Desulfobacteraceae bacterium 4572_88]|nr:MAG: hypothetical protein B6245_09930 [Desulfobacteraceae bacterium 4572_88]